MIDPQIRNKIPNKHVHPAKFLTKRKQNAPNQDQTKIRQKDQLGILRFIQWAGRVKMVHTASDAIGFALAATLALLLVVVVASHIADEIRGPASKLLCDEVDCSGNWCLLGQLGQFMEHISIPRSKHLSCFRDEDHVSLHITSGFVVLAMRNLPREIWYQES